jgi:hypothetical protein
MASTVATPACRQRQARFKVPFLWQHYTTIPSTAFNFFQVAKVKENTETAN